MLFLDPVLRNNEISPTSFNGLETSCPDADSYDNFSLVCTTSKPAIVLPEIDLVWVKDEDIFQGVTTNDGITWTSILTFETSKADDSGFYSCVASVAIPDSPTVSHYVGNSTVTISG